MDLYHALARGAYAAPVLVDLDKDGKLDIVQAAFDANVYAIRFDGSAVPGWPVRVNTSRATVMDRIMTTPTVTDLNGDGIPDVVVGSNEQSAAATRRVPCSRSTVAERSRRPTNRRSLSSRTGRSSARR